MSRRLVFSDELLDHVWNLRALFECLSTAVLFVMFNDSALCLQGFFQSLRVVECSLPLRNGLQVFGYEAFILRAIHSAIIMSQSFSGGKP